MNKNDQFIPIKHKSDEEIKQDKVFKKLSNISLLSSMSLIKMLPANITPATIKLLESVKLDPPPKASKAASSKTKAYPKYPFLIARTCFRIMKDFYKYQFKVIDSKARPKNRNDLTSEKLSPFLTFFMV